MASVWDRIPGVWAGRRGLLLGVKAQEKESERALCLANGGGFSLLTSWPQDEEGGQRRQQKGAQEAGHDD